MPRTTCAPLVLALLAAAPRPVSAQPADRIVEEFARAERFNGVVLVARDGVPDVAGAWGWADAEAGIATALDTRYQLGSISKWLTSIVVLALVDRGVLALDAPIGTYLKDYRSDSGARVTLHHLLTHTSGVPNDIIAAVQADPRTLDEDLPTDEAVRRYASGDLAFEPGTRFDYAHSNWILVKAIVERATGRPFEDTFAALITRPAGLEDTGVFSGDGSDVTGLATGYLRLDPSPERARASIPGYLACAGGMYSTAPDLLALLEALYGGRLLSQPSLDRLDTIHWPDEDYAYGGRVHMLDLGEGAEPVVWQSGSNGPSKSRISRVVSDGRTIITLTNAGTPPEVTGALIERVLHIF